MSLVGGGSAITRIILFCRSRKIKCDNKRPSCGSCVSQGQQCAYIFRTPRERPTLATISSLRADKTRLEKIIQSLKDASPDERDKIFKTIIITGDADCNVGTSPAEAQPPPQPPPSGSVQQGQFIDDSLDYESDADLDVGPFFSVDETGKIDSFGPSSALQGSIHRPSTSEPALEQIHNNLFAHAALQRQREYELYQLPDIDGVPTPLAIHLLDIHWSRQHHTLLLTYRPVITRDLLDGGPYCSSFLLQAIFACSSRFSQRVEVRDDPDDPATAGGRFFRRCDELLGTGMLLTAANVNTTVGLLLLGSTFNALGQTSKGWLYTGYGLRMIYELGFHIDCKVTSENAMRVEIRRRIFWGAFICDKLQSLYLGRPAAIQLRDSHVSRQFMDMYEEKEISMPYIDPTVPSSHSFIPQPAPTYSISTFQHFCLLSKIMIMIINKLYVVGATAAAARASLQTIEDALDSWITRLPKELQYRPESDSVTSNVINLHCIYHSLIILLYRPLISDGHLRLLAPPQSSWKRCTEAALEITHLLLRYQYTYTLRSAPYLLGYALYVACTIHVRNAAASEIASEHSSLLISSLKCLDELSLPNPGVRKPTCIIQNLMRSNNLHQTIDIEGKMLLSEKVIHDPASVHDFDLDAILHMFPGDGDGMVDDDMVAAGNLHYDDILYGFMDM
ncbi:fungal-specific transcription factor domain-containing protein [Trichoderma camerunense]